MEDDDIINVSNLDMSMDISLIPDSGTVWFDTSNNTININDGTSWSTIDVFSELQEWKDKLPDLEKVEEMCKDYPALEKAYENFKTVYKMVEQDWIGRQKSEQDTLL